MSKFTKIDLGIIFTITLIILIVKFLLNQNLENYNILLLLILFILSGYSFMAMLYPEANIRSLLKKPIILLNLSLFLTLSLSLIWNYLYLENQADYLLLMLSIITLLFSIITLLRRRKNYVPVAVPREEKVEPVLEKKLQPRAPTQKKRLIFQLMQHPLDLLIISVLTVLILIFLFYPPLSGNLILNVLGVFFMIVIPGYLIIEALFPKEESLEDIERLGFSFGISLPLTSIVGIILHYTPYGIKLWPIYVILSSLSLILIPIVLIRRKKSK